MRKKRTDGAVEVDNDDMVEVVVVVVDDVMNVDPDEPLSNSYASTPVEPVRIKLNPVFALLPYVVFSRTSVSVVV